MIDAKWVMGIVAALAIAYLSWLSKTVIELETKVEVYDKVVPQPVEVALREIREKGNIQAEACNKAQIVVSGNTQEIGHIKEVVAELKGGARKP